MEQFEQALSKVDALLNVNDLVQTNFTGHPSVVFPISYRERGDARFPRPVKLTGHLYDDERLLKICHALQSQIEAHLKQPRLDFWLQKYDAGTLDDADKSPAEPASDAEPAGD